MVKPSARGVYLKGVGRAISYISKRGGLTDWSFGLHVFDRLFLVVALGIPVMSIVNRDYLKLVLSTFLLNEYEYEYSVCYCMFM